MIKPASHTMLFFVAYIVSIHEFPVIAENSKWQRYHLMCELGAVRLTTVSLVSSLEEQTHELHVTISNKHSKVKIG